MKIIKNTKYSSGFTLAEVLITMSIIGVVSVLLITVVQNIQQAEFINKWKKVYSTINQTYASILLDNGGTIKGVSYTQPAYKNLFRDKLSVVKDCDLNSGGVCWHANDAGGTYTAQYLNKTFVTNSFWSFANSFPAIVLADGTMIYFVHYDDNCNWAGQGMCTLIHIDINGFAKPNQYGKDLYTISVTATGISPGYGVTDNCVPGGVGYNCGRTYLSK